MDLAKSFIVSQVKEEIPPQEAPQMLPDYMFYRCGKRPTRDEVVAYYKSVAEVYES